MTTLKGLYNIEGYLTFASGYKHILIPPTLTPLMLQGDASKKGSIFYQSSVGCVHLFTKHFILQCRQQKGYFLE